MASGMQIVAVVAVLVLAIVVGLGLFLDNKIRYKYIYHEFHDESIVNEKKEICYRIEVDAIKQTWDGPFIGKIHFGASNCDYGGDLDFRICETEECKKFFAPKKFIYKSSTFFGGSTTSANDFTLERVQDGLPFAIPVEIYDSNRKKLVTGHIMSSKDVYLNEFEKVLTRCKKNHGKSVNILLIASVGDGKTTFFVTTYNFLLAKGEGGELALPPAATGTSTVRDDTHTSYNELLQITDTFGHQYNYTNDLSSWKKLYSGRVSGNKYILLNSNSPTHSIDPRLQLFQPGLGFYALTADPQTDVDIVLILIDINSDDTKIAEIQADIIPHVNSQIAALKNGKKQDDIAMLFVLTKADTISNEGDLKLKIDELKGKLGGDVFAIGANLHKGDTNFKKLKYQFEAADVIREALKRVPRCSEERKSQN